MCAKVKKRILIRFNCVCRNKREKQFTKAYVAMTILVACGFKMITSQALFANNFV